MLYFRSAGQAQSGLTSFLKGTMSEAGDLGTTIPKTPWQKNHAKLVKTNTHQYEFKVQMHAWIVTTENHQSVKQIKVLLTIQYYQKPCKQQTYVAEQGHLGSGVWWARLGRGMGPT